MTRLTPSFWKHLLFGVSNLLSLALFARQTHALDLKPETLHAWDEHVSEVRADNRQRLLAGHSFVWAEEDENRLQQVMNGEPQAAPLVGRGSGNVPSGLIHHWVGATFIPNVTLDDVLSVTRDYDHYEQMFRPSVVHSQTLSRSEDNAVFSVVMATKVMFVSAGLDVKIQSEIAKVDAHRAYSSAITTGVQEIQNYGKPDERRLEPDHGNGFVWRLFTVNRYQEREGGVLFEVETLALSRDIPGSVRFVVTPVVRRVSRNAILISLQQTQKAVQDRSVTAHRGQKPRLPAREEHEAGPSAEIANSAFRSNH